MTHGKIQEVNTCLCGAINEWQVVDKEGNECQPDHHWSGYFKCLRCGTIAQLFSDTDEQWEEEHLKTLICHMSNGIDIEWTYPAIWPDHMARQAFISFRCKIPYFIKQYDPEQDTMVMDWTAAHYDKPEEYEKVQIEFERSKVFELTVYDRVDFWKYPWENPLKVTIQESDLLRHLKFFGVPDTEDTEEIEVTNNYNHFVDSSKVGEIFEWGTDGELHKNSKLERIQ